MFGFPNQQGGFPGGWGFQAPAVSSKFQQYFRCYPVIMMQGNTRDELNYGGKIIMPPSALNKLSRLHITYPMKFELSSDETGLSTHAGVLEFIAPEGHIYIPQWMMETLAVAPGSLIKITNTTLELGTFVKIEPQSVDFLEISDPRAVLENAFRNYTTITKDDVLQISYNDKIYSIKVLEVKPESPSHAISVVETDLEVDFAPPVGYVEPTPDSRPGSVISKGNSKANSNANSGTSTPSPLGAMAKSINYEQMLRKEITRSKANNFHGSGYKLSSTSKPSVSSLDRKGKFSSLTKQKKDQQLQEAQQKEDADISARITSELPSSDVAPLSLPFGQLFFGYPVIPLKSVDVEKEMEWESSQLGPSNGNSKSDKSTFEGSGQSLRKSKKRKGTSKLEEENISKRNSPSPKHDVIEID